MECSVTDKSTFSQRLIVAQQMLTEAQDLLSELLASSQPPPPHEDTIRQAARKALIGHHVVAYDIKREGLFCARCDLQFEVVNNPYRDCELKVE
jgi:hypothetical protein